MNIGKYVLGRGGGTPRNVIGGFGGTTPKVIGGFGGTTPKVIAGVTAMACAVVLLWPGPTCAEEVSDEERAGGASEDGEQFGEIVVKAEIAADAKAPSGWVLVRTISNPSDETQTATVEERIMRSESMLGARVQGTPVVASATLRTFTLGPHEKKTVGIALPAAIGQAITHGKRTKAAAEQMQAVMGNDGKGPTPAQLAVYNRTFGVYFPQYLKPLAPGETAARVLHPTGPERMMPTVPPPVEGGERGEARPRVAEVFE